ncbi:uncharacterized protein LOC141908960 [Tubulanus polymorphus]|uniref:uncharacterized protein LOC141908960 n=1 Tax=Tubulanus polymorphus TaxID=672921 RepID=UPI003DA587F6
MGNWRLRTVKHSKQLDSSSCGVFVLKFAESILANETLEFDNTSSAIDQYRFEIAMWLMGSIATDPSKMCCLCCHASSIHVTDWIGCDRCFRWFHLACYNRQIPLIGSNIASSVMFFCKYCKAIDSEQENQGNPIGNGNLPDASLVQNENELHDAEFVTNNELPDIVPPKRRKTSDFEFENTTACDNKTAGTKMRKAVKKKKKETGGKMELPKKERTSKQEKDIAPFYMKERSTRIKRCQGCPTDLKSRLVVASYGNYQFFDKRSASKRDSWRVGYFHPNATCILRKYPEFDGNIFMPSDVVISDEECIEILQKGLKPTY